MRARPGLPAVLLAAALLLTGCHGDDAAPAASSASPGVTVGGSAAPSKAPPDRRMDGLERPVADRLARQVRSQGLTLSYLDCPRWKRRVPARIHCRGYVDGLVVGVEVHLRAAVAGKAVSFDAHLDNGVIATRNLERTLHARGWRTADCGDVAAYRATPGARIVCRVSRRGAEAFVVARVQDRSGRVMISGYRGPAASASP